MNKLELKKFQTLNSSKIGTEGSFSNLFSEASITLIPKPGKDTTTTNTKTKQNYRPISMMNIEKKKFNKPATKYKYIYEDHPHNHVDFI